MSDKLCIDLCSGLGGFSRAFVDNGWEVVTVDNEKKFKPTIIGDILTITAKEIPSSSSYRMVQGRLCKICGKVLPWHLKDYCLQCCDVSADMLWSAMNK